MFQLFLQSNSSTNGTTNSTATKPAAAPSKGNTSNLEDDPVTALIIIIPLMCFIFYVFYRLICLCILSGSHNKNYPKIGGWWRKFFWAFFPVMFTVLLVIRSLTHWTNNACNSLVPFSYFFRILMHACCLSYQFIAILAIRCDPMILYNRPWVPLLFLAVFSVPAVVLLILIPSLGIGIPFGGVCTLGYTDGRDQIKFGDYSMGAGWALGVELYELSYIVINIIVEIVLTCSKGLGNITKFELREMTRVSTALIIYDIIFRFNIVQYIFGKIFVVVAVRTVFLKIFSISFTIIYCGCIGAFAAHSLCLAHVWYFRLHPFNKRFWLLLVRKDFISQAEFHYFYNDFAPTFGYKYMLREFFCCKLWKYEMKTQESESKYKLVEGTPGTFVKEKELQDAPTPLQSIQADSSPAVATPAPETPAPATPEHFETQPEVVQPPQTESEPISQQPVPTPQEEQQTTEVVAAV